MHITRHLKIYQVINDGKVERDDDSAIIIGNIIALSSETD